MPVVESVHCIKCITTVLLPDLLLHMHFFSCSIKVESEQMETEQLYFRDDTTLPIYSTRSSSYSASDLYDILLSDDLNAC